MIRIKSSGSFWNTKRFLKRAASNQMYDVLVKYGYAGVEALQNATPKRTGKTSQSWDFEIVKENGRTTVYWTNSNIQQGINIALIIQFGHATGRGAYVTGIDYINPALKPVFEEMAAAAWKEVIGE